MTVIAYSARHRIVAADSRASDDTGAYHLTNCPKIARMQSGALLGLAGDGDARDLVTLLERVTPKTLPTRAQIAELKLDAVGLLVFPSGQVFTVTGQWSPDREQWYGEVFRISDRIVAVGSGAAYAYGAMEVGATPVEAVKAACRRDLMCAAPVQWEKLG